MARTMIATAINALTTSHLVLLALIMIHVKIVVKGLDTLVMLEATGIRARTLACLTTQINVLLELVTIKTHVSVL